MDTSRLKKFAQYARRTLLEQVSTKLKLVIREESPYRRERAEAVRKLEADINKHGQEQIVERVAYTWFNRFCALRFMDVNHYNRVKIVSPADLGQFQPEILAEAKMGHIDEEMVGEKIRQQVLALLSGSVQSHDPQGEAYRLLVVAACNFWNKAMPFLFQHIDDYTELLMPDDLLSGNSILAYTREAMTPEVCGVKSGKKFASLGGGVEAIGWLYQFYISEKKDEVFEGLKKNKKITPENIPAATQLFTPHWIVRYLVENSLGRLWMLNRPNSRLIEKMEYYIAAVASDQGLVGSGAGSTHSAFATKEEFLRVEKPEEIKVCDPACGSGHMLTYAFDLLHAIYEEEGYEPSEIPEKILTHNLYGVEIDERAGALAAFALSMKARARQRRFFSKGIKPNICILEELSFTENELMIRDSWAVESGASLKAIWHDLNLFTESDNFGSLLRPKLSSDQCLKLRIFLANQPSTEISPTPLYSKSVHKKVLQALDQAQYLCPKYHVVIANPPYMGGKGMNPRLSEWLKLNYESVKSDLFSAFIVRNTELALKGGQLGFMTPFVWMFISSYEKLRLYLIEEKTITSLVQLEYSGFDGATVPICTFTLENAHHPNFKGGYVRLSDFKGSDQQGPKALEIIQAARRVGK